MPPSATVTGSLNWSVIALGVAVSTAPGAGFVLSSVACANAGDASTATNTTASAATTSARRAATFTNASSRCDGTSGTPTRPQQRGGAGLAREQPQQPETDELGRVATELRHRVRSRRRDVDARGEQQAQHERSGERQHAADALGPPRGDEESDAEGDRERAEVARRVRGQSGVVAEDEGRERDEDLDERHRGETGAQTPDPTVVGRLDRGHDRRRQVGHRFGRPEAQAPVHGRGGGVEVAAIGTGAEMDLERRLGGGEVLAVEPGRDRGASVGAVHALVVRSGRGLVPQYRRPAVDDLTALLTDARGGDRV